MNKICFLPFKYHLNFMILLFILYYWSFGSISFILICIYSLIVFLFRVGKQRNNKFIKNDNYMDEFIYAPIYGKVIEVSKKEKYNLIKLKAQTFSIKHSWSISSPKDLVVQNINFDASFKQLEIKTKQLTILINNNLLRCVTILGVGDRMYSRSIFGYMPFGGIMELKVNLDYKLLIKNNDYLERSKTIIAKLK